MLTLIILALVIYLIYTYIIENPKVTTKQGEGKNFTVTEHKDGRIAFDQEFVLATRSANLPKSDKWLTISNTFPAPLSAMHSADVRILPCTPDAKDVIKLADVSYFLSNDKSKITGYSCVISSDVPTKDLTIILTARFVGTK